MTPGIQYSFWLNAFLSKPGFELTPTVTEPGLATVYKALFYSKLMTHHEWEADGGGFDLLDDSEEPQTDTLDHCEHVNPPGRNVAQEHIIRLCLLRHEEQQEPVHQLETQTNGNFK